MFYGVSTFVDYLMQILILYDLLVNNFKVTLFLNDLLERIGLLRIK